MRQLLANFRAVSLRWAAACLLGASAVSAQAVVIASTNTGSGQPGTDVVLTTTVDVSPDALFDFIFFSATYNPAEVTLNSVSMTRNGLPFQLSDLAPSGTVSESVGTDTYAFAFRAEYDFSTPRPPIPLPGQWLISLNYHLDSSMVVGTDSTVQMQFTSTGPDAVFHEVSLTTISAVPEPESWVLALVGLPLVLSLARRRAQSQRA